MNHAEKYCETLALLPKGEAINAIHQAYLQLSAMSDWQGIETDNPRRVACIDGITYDNESALQNLSRMLRIAGHIGFTK